MLELEYNLTRDSFSCFNAKDGGNEDNFGVKEVSLAKGTQVTRDVPSEGVLAGGSPISLSWVQNPGSVSWIHMYAFPSTDFATAIHCSDEAHPVEPLQAVLTPFLIITLFASSIALWQ